LSAEAEPATNLAVEPQRRVRVLVADDHPLFREGIVRSVKERPDLELVGVAENGREALEEVRRLQPDIALIDVKMPGLDGLQVLNALVRDGAPTKVVFLSAYPDSGIVYKALEGGAQGFLSKDAGKQAVTDALAAVARGETVLSPTIQREVFGEIRLRARDDRERLTPRENEILRLIAEGLSAPDIGKRLFLSPATVKTHLQRLYEKLGVSERAAAVAEAMRRGLIE
jgi:two-component system nitrate/nitrite response regulator NarL